MKVSIGLPSTIPGVDCAEVVAWARQADDGPFHSLAVLDRIVFDNLESLVTLAVVAGVTHRIRLMTTVLLAPTRPAGLLAKQAASIDRFSRGRLTLGLGIGSRPDDYVAATATWSNRGRRLEQELETMAAIWSGKRSQPDLGPIGPEPVQFGGPEILLGGSDPRAIARVGRWGHGYISGGGGSPDAVINLYQAASRAWSAAGRSGRPRLVACVYFAIGEENRSIAEGYLRTYYGSANPYAQSIIGRLVTSPQAVAEALERYAQAGADELVFWPCVAQRDQLERLAQAVS